MRRRPAKPGPARTVNVEASRRSSDATSSPDLVDPPLLHLEEVGEVAADDSSMEQNAGSLAEVAHDEVLAHARGRRSDGGQTSGASRLVRAAGGSRSTNVAAERIGAASLRAARAISRSPAAAARRRSGCRGRTARAGGPATCRRSGTRWRTRTLDERDAAGLTAQRRARRCRPRLRHGANGIEARPPC